jgi:hypothetical protein
MSIESPDDTLTRVLMRTGLSYPRGVLGEQTATLAAALDGGVGGADLDQQAAAAAAELWVELQPAMAASLRRHLEGAIGPDAADLRAILIWADDGDSDNPLSRALAVRAAQELAAAVQRARTVVAAAEPAIAAGGPEGAIAVARAAGLAVVELLDLDPEDFAPEIATYVDGGESADALDELARATGDEEIRGWAHDALDGISATGPGEARAAMRLLVEAEPEDDPAKDPIWVPAILALVEQGFERALVASAVDAAAEPPNGKELS